MCPLLCGGMVAAVPWHSSGLLLAVVAVVWLVLAYRWYGRWLERKTIAPTDAKTPAEAQYDGVDYCPARPVVLFGHHFASIAGAGPIIGPIMAVAAFGWTPTALWVLLGVVLIGAVHDYLTLMISVRNRGNSLPDVARSILGGPARVLFLIFVWIGLVLVITSFCAVTTDTFIEAPQIVFPTFALMLIAILFGVLTYRLNMKTWLSTAIALALMAGVVALGFVLPIRLEDLGVPAGSVRTVWLLVLLAYGVIASVVPVWILLQPRDYLSTWILLGGMLAGFVGIVWVQPALKAPAVTENLWSPQPLWPMMFITVACGAVSGFHCLVAGGTTSKQEARAQADYLLADLALEFASEMKDEDAKKKNYMEAVSRFTDIVASYPDSPYAPKSQYKKALVYEKMGLIDQACEEYVKLSYRYPDNELVAETIARLGQYFLSKGKELRAKATPEITPVEREKLEMQAREMSKTAGQVFGRLAVRFPTHRLAGRTLVLSAQCYMQAEDLPKAIEVFKTLAETPKMEPDLVAEATYWCGDCYMKRGDPMNAYRQFKRLTWDYPASKWAKFARGRLTEEALVRVGDTDANK